VGDDEMKDSGTYVYGGPPQLGHATTHGALAVAAPSARDTLDVLPSSYATVGEHVTANLPPSPRVAPTGVGPTAKVPPAVRHRTTAHVAPLPVRPVPDSGARRAPPWVRAALQGSKLAPEPLVLRPGRVIPGTRYEIVRWLGQGAMGVVYEAEHLDMERRAAVKILRSGVGSNPAMLQAFRDEARAASRIRSDQVVQLYDFAELADQRLMIAMELLPGTSLSHELSPADPMDLARAVGILRQVCQGLTAAHEAGVVHRDVKPENVHLTTRNGRADAVKLLDFGIAAIHDGSDVAFIRGGTPSYLAPEVSVDGSAEVSVDVYSWGCMAFELLTGRVPFEGETTGELLCAHLVQEPVPPSSLRPTLPSAFDAVVLRCLEKDPHDRYASMAEVEAALCEAQLESGLRTAWDDLPLPMVDPERRARLVALVPDTPTLSASPRRRSVMLMAAAGLLISITTGIDALASRESDLTERVAPSTWVEDRGTEARNAAAKALFVYPPADQPDHPTAYTVVRTLEAHEGPEDDRAQELAEELRDEFASTLVRLGDHYWHKKGGERFARAYYDQALLFDPERSVAQERRSLSESFFERFEQQAATLAFTEAELLGAEPLVVLAAPDVESRREKLVALQEQREQRAAELRDDLVRLGDLNMEDLAVHPGTNRPWAPGGAGKAAGASMLVLADQGDDMASYEVALEEPAPVVDSRDEEDDEDDDGAALRRAPTSPAQARKLASQGQRAMVSGNVGRAAELFEQALGHDRSNAKALAGLRDVEFERGDYHRAVKLGERVVRKRSKTASHRLRLGDAYLKVLRYRDALAQYEKALALGESRAKWRIDKVRGKIGPR